MEWVLSEQPGQRMSVSALNDVFRTQTKAERERLAGLVAEVRAVVTVSLTLTRTITRRSELPLWKRDLLLELRTKLHHQSAQRHWQPTLDFVACGPSRRIRRNGEG